MAFKQIWSLANNQNKNNVGFMTVDLLNKWLEKMLKNIRKINTFY